MGIICGDQLDTKLPGNFYFSWVNKRLHRNTMVLDFHIKIITEKLLIMTGDLYCFVHHIIFCFFGRFQLLNLLLIPINFLLDINSFLYLFFCILVIIRLFDFINFSLQFFKFFRCSFSFFYRFCFFILQRFQ